MPKTAPYKLLAIANGIAKDKRNLEIFCLYPSLTYKEIGLRYGLTSMAVCNIVRKIKAKLSDPHSI